ncbi:MAG TPA: hypothetical protein VKZ58_11965 [Longimicrobiales bacterium]|nr:hypothetical protein [Longimicrobiales bacterium]
MIRGASVRAVLRGALLAASLGLAGAGCDDPDGPGGPGVYEVVIESPNGPEGAAVVQLTGSGIEGARSADARVFVARVERNTSRVVVVRDEPGELRFQVEVRDLGAPMLSAVLLQVADGNNELRGSLAGYRVSLIR